MSRKKLPIDQLRIMPILSVRLDQTEFDTLERVAKQKGKSRSDFARSIVRDALKKMEVNNNG